MKSNPEQKFELKTMSPEDLRYALDWAEKEGWNPGVYDSECFYHIDPKGFFIGEFMGRPIGCISAVRYNDAFGFIGLFIIEEEFRKKWFGIYLARTALSYLDRRNIGLNGMIDRIDTYENIGFKTAYRCLRFEGKAENHNTENATDASEVPFDELVKYDAKMFPVSRPQFLKCWISQPESSAVCVVEKNKIKGFGVLRKSREGYKIGPLFADSEKIADKLFNVLASSAPHEKIYIDVPDVNKTALKLVERHKMRICFETVRMYSKKQPSYPVKNIYGITSIELG